MVKKGRETEEREEEGAVGGRQKTQQQQTNTLHNTVYMVVR